MGIIKQNEGFNRNNVLQTHIVIPSVLHIIYLGPKKTAVKRWRLSRRHKHLSAALPEINHNELRHEISNNVVCATSKASDQPAHARSLIRAFASRLNIL